MQFPSRSHSSLTLGAVVAARPAIAEERGPENAFSLLLHYTTHILTATFHIKAVAEMPHLVSSKLSSCNQTDIWILFPCQRFSTLAGTLLQEAHWRAAGMVPPVGKASGDQAHVPTQSSSPNSHLHPGTVQPGPAGADLWPLCQRRRPLSRAAIIYAAEARRRDPEDSRHHARHKDNFPLLRRQPRAHVPSRLRKANQPDGNGEENRPGARGAETCGGSMVKKMSPASQAFPVSAQFSAHIGPSERGSLVIRRTLRKLWDFTVLSVCEK